VTRYPFADLPANLASFCDLLRRDHRFRVGPRELRDAARALVGAPLADERAVRDVLRPILSHTREDVLAFDEAFRQFFLPGLTAPGPPPLPGLARASTSRTPDATSSRPRDGEHDDVREASDGGSLQPAELSQVDEANGDGDRRFVRASYSPLDAQGQPPELEGPDAAWRGAAHALVNRLRVRLSRRWLPAPRGRRFDLRRTLRGSLHTGGEAVVPRWRARLRRQPRLVVLIDGSRSMGVEASRALACAVALAAVTPKIEVFTFSTAVRRVTHDVRRAAAGEAHRLPPVGYAWGGGTSIGASLRELLTRWGASLLGDETVVVIASDGLEVGHPDILREAMARLHREAAAIIWLNPLLMTAGYEPTARGMRVARPFITTFAWAGDAAGLRRLSQIVRVG
jgi:uncharacterized protein